MDHQYNTNLVSVIIGLQSVENLYVNMDTSVYSCFLDLSQTFGLVFFEFTMGETF